MKKLVLETTAPFQGLPELVAYAEGLFEWEGLTIEWAEREGADKSTEINVGSPKGLNPFFSDGKMLEQGQAEKDNAGNGATTAASRTPRSAAARSAAAASSGRHRGASICRRSPRSSSPAPSGCRSISAPTLRTASAGRLSAPREIKLCRTSNGSRSAVRRHDDGRDRGHHADRALCDAGGEERVPPDLRGVLPRHRSGIGPGSMPRRTPHSTARSAKRCGRINANKARLSPLFHRLSQERMQQIAALKPGGYREEPHRGLLSFVDPCSTRCSAPTTGSRGWGMLEETASPLDLINLQVQQHAHTVAAE